MTLLDNEVAVIVVLRRKRRTFFYIAEEIGSRWQAALGIAGGRVRTGCWGSDEVSGDAFD